MKVWRLVKSRYVASAFDGEGPRVFGGRWNSPGVRVAYASDHPAGAAMEVLAHVENETVQSAYSLISAHIPDEFIEYLDPKALPGNWNNFPVPPAVQNIGDEWVKSLRSLAFVVPSALVPHSRNILINPGHRRFDRLRADSVEPFGFDSRLIAPRK